MAGNSWFLFYSGNRYEHKSYAVGYAKCDTGAEPGVCIKVTTKTAGSWLNDNNSSLNGPGGQGFFKFENDAASPGNETFMIVHAWPDACAAGDEGICLDYGGNNASRKLYLFRVENKNSIPSKTAL